MEQNIPRSKSARADCSCREEALMKTKLGITIFLLLLLSFAFVPPFILKVSAQSTILADIINSSASAVNYANDIWINRESLTHMGILLGKLAMADYDAEAQYLAGVSDWVDLICLLRIAEIDGYTSATLRSLGTQALNSHPMVGALPLNWQGQYLNFYRNELHGYDYANQWGVSSWNLQAAYNAFLQAYESSSTFPWSIASGGNVTQDNRHYDGGAQTLDAFLEFDEMGVSGALAEADNVWNRINAYSWPGYYPYHLGTQGTECEIGFSMIAGEYAQRKDGSIAYGDRLITDINYKLLSQGWNSADWAPGGYVFCHAYRNTEHRLPNTEDGIMVLHAFYPQFTDAMKTSFQQLLQGYDSYLPAWQGLLSTDLVQSSGGVYLFRPNSMNSWSIPRLLDTGTAQASILMFLEGIVPVTGSLNIVKRDEVYEDVCSAMSANDFLFDYANHRIKIPVRAGLIDFQFGTGVASYTFPTSATYTVQFSSDWNSVISARAGEPRTWIVDDDGPASFHTIQEGINAASDGDTIFVRNGTYYENVVVNKTLNLRGESRNSTIVDGNNTGNVVTLVSNNANVSGFTFQHSAGALYSCIRLDQVSGCSIFSNNVDNSNSSASGDGIFLQSSEQNNISDNLVINTWDGITFHGSCNNTILGNTVVNRFNVAGTSIQFVYGSAFNQAIGNAFLGVAQIGIRCYTSDSGSNVLIGNTVENHYFGIYADGSSDNIFYYNSIVNNTINQAYISGVNVWCNGYPSGGNYWSDYNGTDMYSGSYQNETGSDGIGDTPYVIDSNNIDNYPLMHGYGSIQNLDTNIVYLTIQSAIDAPETLNGHTIFVKNGIYDEVQITVNKSVNLLGQSRSETFVSNHLGDPVFKVIADNVEISGFRLMAHSNYGTITSWSVENLMVSDNFITSDGHGDNGVYLQDCFNATVAGNIFQDPGSYCLTSDASWGGRIESNIFNSSGAGIYLAWKGNFTIIDNTLVNFKTGTYAIRLLQSNDNVIYHNNLVNNVVQVSLTDSFNNTWDKGYPSGGNYWSDYNGTDLYNGPYQNETESDGIGDRPYNITAENQDRYPLMNPWTSPDIAVVNVTSSKTLIGQGFALNINVTITNQGNKIESFNVTISANTTSIASQTTVLTSGNSATLSFTWNTTGFAYGNYTINACAWPVPGETNTASNNLTGGVVTVTIPGDVNHDGTVNILDTIIVGSAFLATSSSSNWNPNTDINSDNVVNMLDAIIQGNHFLEHYP
jgi:parallel beta-helix repeat protein